VSFLSLLSDCPFLFLSGIRHWAEKSDAPVLSCHAHGADSAAEALEVAGRGGGGVEERDGGERCINGGVDGLVEAQQVERVQQVQHATGQVER